MSWRSDLRLAARLVLGALGGLGLVVHKQVIGRVDHIVDAKDRARMGSGLD